MTDTKHNGWTNYPTWRVRCELFDDTRDFENLTSDQIDPQWAEEFAEQIIFNEDAWQASLMESYARSWLSEVNWHEIANHIRKMLEEIEADE